MSMPELDSFLAPDTTDTSLECSGAACEYRQFAETYEVDFPTNQSACERFKETAAFHGKQVSCGAAVAAIVSMGMRGRE